MSLGPLATLSPLDVTSSNRSEAPSACDGAPAPRRRVSGAPPGVRHSCAARAERSPEVDAFVESMQLMREGSSCCL
jgi:hypothetical protein